MSLPRKTIGLILTVIIIAGVLGGFQLLKSPKQSSPKSLIITLTEDGFSPAESTIKKGDTVVFQTTTNKHFWPASDLHPTHGIYPEFDPQEPVDPKKTWSFTFEKVGTWKFHDHLSPYYTGSITVTEK